MSLRDQLLNDVQRLDPGSLARVFQFVQALKHPASPPIRTLRDEWAGTLSDEDAAEMTGLIDQEFGKIEGDW